MADLATRYLGLTLKNPLVVSASPLSEKIDTIKELAAAGASAIVLYSLFEEQIEIQGMGLAQRSPSLPAALRHVPEMEGYNRGVNGYLAHLYQARRAVDIPIIGSLNGYYSSGWVQYARLIEAAGADALELNVYYMPTRPQMTGTEVEQMYVELVQSIKSNVTIPVAVKISPYFSAIANMAQRLASAGADGLVIFNRFYQPDFDLETETAVPTLDLSQSSELRLRLRWAAILSSFLRADLAITGGVHTHEDVLKCMLAGARVAMMTSALLTHGPDHLNRVLQSLDAWLEARAYPSIQAIQGKLNQTQAADTSAFERANYMRVLTSFGK
ncbi:MAG: dihydroorotate dehydrogenase-like protein [Anaerolineales bacterium]|nr:dihydroorotate dehydrogenase-like protein [Anaerolineales bacterium]